MDVLTDTQAPHDDLTPDGWRWSIPRALGIAAFVGMAVFWVWVFANGSSIEHPDTFQDPTYTAAAESVCAKRQAAIAEFPAASAAENPVQRGELIELGTEQLEAMLGELAVLTPPTDQIGADGVVQWLDDYDLYLSDRRVYSEVLATGDDPAFLLSANDQGVRVTDMLHTFAEVNEMPSCAPSGDV